MFYPYNTNTKTINIKKDLFINMAIYNTQSIISQLYKITEYNLTLPQLETSHINLNQFDSSAK